MPTIPAAVPSDGTVSVMWVTALADASAPSLATEINAASSVALECYLKENFSPDASTDAVEDRRMCSKQVFQTPGTTTVTIADLIGVYDPQDLAGTDSKAYAALTSGAKGFLVVRWGVDVDTAWAAGDLVDVFPVTIANRIKLAPEANSQLKFKATPMVTGEVVEDVEVAA